MNQAWRAKDAGRWARLAPGLAALARYDRRWLSKDVLSGISVAAIALPVGLAYADLAGVPAIVGIYSAIFPLFAYVLFGSSRQLIVGPDAATCLLVAASSGRSQPATRNGIWPCCRCSHWRRAYST
jgi:sulfate permease, SulP family